MKRHTHSHTHGERICLGTAPGFSDVENFCVPV